MNRKAKRGTRKWPFGQLKSVWTTRALANASLSLASTSRHLKTSDWIDIDENKTPKHPKHQFSESDSDEWLDVITLNDLDSYAEEHAANDLSDDTSTELVREGTRSPEFHDSFDDQLDISSSLDEYKKVSTLHETSRDIKDMMPSFSLSPITESIFTCQAISVRRACIEQTNVATNLRSLSFSSKRLDIRMSLEKTLRHEITTTCVEPRPSYPNTSFYEDFHLSNDINNDIESPTELSIEDTELNTVLEVQKINDLDELLTRSLHPVRISTAITDRRNCDVDNDDLDELVTGHPVRTSTPISDRRNHDISLSLSEINCSENIITGPALFPELSTVHKPTCISIPLLKNESPKKEALTTSQNSNVTKPVNSMVKQKRLSEINCSGNIITGPAMFPELSTVHKPTCISIPLKNESPKKEALTTSQNSNVTKPVNSTVKQKQMPSEITQLPICSLASFLKMRKCNKYVRKYNIRSKVLKGKASLPNKKTIEEDFLVKFK